LLFLGFKYKLEKKAVTFIPEVGVEDVNFFVDDSKLVSTFCVEVCVSTVREFESLCFFVGFSVLLFVVLFGCDEVVGVIFVTFFL